MENKVYTEYDNERMIYLSLQIVKSSYFKDKWCWLLAELKRFIEDKKISKNDIIRIEVL